MLRFKIIKLRVKIEYEKIQAVNPVKGLPCIVRGCQRLCMVVFGSSTTMDVSLVESDPRVNYRLFLIS